MAPREIDLSRRTAGGYAILRIDGESARITGWAKPRPVEGDFLLLDIGRYRVARIRYRAKKDEAFTAELSPAVLADV